MFGDIEEIRLVGSLVVEDTVDFAVGIMAALEVELELEAELAAFVGLGVVAAQLVV
jgi:hypothetical protein